MTRDNVEPRPFLEFEYGPRNQRRKGGGGGGGKKAVTDITEHGRDLLRQAEEFQKIIDAQAQARSDSLPSLPDEYQVILESQGSKGVTPEEVKTLGMSFVEEREGGVLVAVSPDKSLKTLVEKTHSYVEEQTKSGKPRYEGPISSLSGFHPSVLEDKIGDRLLEVLDNYSLDDKIRVDIELRGGRLDVGETSREQFQAYIRQLNERHPDDPDGYHASELIFPPIIEDEYSLHRCMMPVYAILDLLNSSQAVYILLIDLIPEVEDDFIRLNSVTAGGVLPLPQLGQNVPRIVVVDSGIATGHPIFTDGNGNSIIGRERNFLPTSVEPAELTADEVEGGHGTAIASIAAYGSLKIFVLNQNEEAYPTFWIENAKVMLPESKLKSGGAANQAKLHYSQHPKDLMRRVVEMFHHPNPLLCKIFNLSIGSAPHRLKTPISNWAEEIDNLSALNDILFVVSAGNLHKFEISSFIGNGGNYPAYLLDQRSRLRNPSQAYSAITVGALSESDVIPLRHKASGAPLAKAEHPAPFTRCGLLFSRVVKPDVVEWGGNFFTDTTSGVKECPELSIPVANKDFVQSRLFTYMCGTSVAAPRVTHLAAQIQQQNPWASSNLIRALIINSAAD